MQRNGSKGPKLDVYDDDDDDDGDDDDDKQFKNKSPAQNNTKRQKSK